MPTSQALKVVLFLQFLPCIFVHKITTRVPGSKCMVQPTATTAMYTRFDPTHTEVRVSTDAMQRLWHRLQRQWLFSTALPTLSAIFPTVVAGARGAHGTCRGCVPCSHRVGRPRFESRTMVQDLHSVLLRARGAKEADCTPSAIGGAIRRPPGWCGLVDEESTRLVPRLRPRLLDVRRLCASQRRSVCKHRSPSV